MVNSSHPAKSCMAWEPDSRYSWTAPRRADHHNYKKTNQDIYIIKGLSKALLVLPAIESLHLITHLYTMQTKGADFVARNQTVFRGLGKLKEPFNIELE